MIKKLLLIFIISIIYCSAEVVTTTKIQESKGIGIGETRNDAINEAIIEAVGQINGVKIKKKTIIENFELEDEQGGKISLKYNAKINKYTSGKADSYKVLSVVKRNDGLYEAAVLILNKKVHKVYKTPGLNPKNRRSIIVLPANLIDGKFILLDESKSSSLVNINLSQELINSITQTRKFNVLDREENRAYYNEKSILQSTDSGKNEILKLGQVMGTDYILLTSIKDFNIAKEKGNKYISSINDNNSFNASVTIQFKVITMATRQVKFSNTRTFNFKPSGKNQKQLYYDTLKYISNKISTELIENIYPLKVSNIEEGDIFLNQGNLEEGSKYEVFKLGKRIIDSYTNESLGRSEIKIGTIKIIRSLPKYSVGKIVQGKVSKGNIARKLFSDDKSSDIYNKIGKESNAEITESGGVKLPF